MAEFDMRSLVAEVIERDRATMGRDDYVIACAAELFLAKGIENVKMVEIARAADVGVATIYRHFATKTHLAVSAATLIQRCLNARLAHLVESEEFLALSGLLRLRALLERYCSIYEEQDELVAFIDDFEHLMLTCPRPNRDDLEVYGSELDYFYKAFEDAYLKGREDGSIVRVVAFGSYYHAVTYSLVGVARKLRRGEFVSVSGTAGEENELRCVVRMLLWSLASDVGIPDVTLASNGRTGSGSRLT